MELSQRKRVILFSAIIYLLAAVFAVYCLTLKRDALQFQQRDYSYFIEQAARLADPGLTNRFAMNIDGFNYLGLQGTEGVKSLYHAIHAEWFRYTYALLYWIFHDTLAIYIFYSLVFFSPILYFAILPRPQSNGAWKLVVLYALLFVLFPGMINAVSAELRPRILFVSAWALVILSIYYDRPLLEKLVFFGLLLIIREEGALLGLAAAAFNLIRMWGKAGKWKQTILFVALDIAAFGVFLGFMAWGGFTRVDSLTDPRNFLQNLFTLYPGWIAGAMSLIILLLAAFWIKGRRHFPTLLWVLVYSAGILLPGLQFMRDLGNWIRIQNAAAPVSASSLYLHIATGDGTALVYYASVLLLALLWDTTRGVPRALLQVGMTLLCVLFAATTLYSLPVELSGWAQKVPGARLVWDFKQAHDPYTTQVLLDYDTYQAFYNYENDIVYNRLPVWIAASDARFYPKDTPFVVDLIKQRMEYAVISRGSLENVRELARLAGMPAAEVAANDSFVVLKFR